MVLTEEIRTRGWKQGSVLPPAFFASLAERAGFAIEDGVRSLILTQDCDLLHPSLETEPWVEVLTIRSIDACNAGCMHGKSARKLHLFLPIDGVNTPCEISVHERNRLPREKLLEGDPDASATISTDDLRGILSWFSRRYTREALPDAFNARLRRVEGWINASPHAERVLALYVDRGWDEELDQEEKYTITLVALTRSHDPEELQLVQVEYLDPLITALEQENIRVPIFGVISTKDFTIHDATVRFRRLEYDHLSRRNDPETPSAPRL